MKLLNLIYVPVFTGLVLSGCSSGIKSSENLQSNSYRIIERDYTNFFYERAKELRRELIIYNQVVEDKESSQSIKKRASLLAKIVSEDIEFYMELGAEQEVRENPPVDIKIPCPSE